MFVMSHKSIQHLYFKNNDPTNVFYIIFTIFLFWLLFGSGIIYFQQQLLLLVTSVSAAPCLWRQRVTCRFENWHQENRQVISTVGWRGRYWGSQVNKERQWHTHTHTRIHTHTLTWTQWRKAANFRLHSICAGLDSCLSRFRQNTHLLSGPQHQTGFSTWVNFL